MFKHKFIYLTCVCLVLFLNLAFTRDGFAAENKKLPAGEFEILPPVSGQIILGFSAVSEYGKGIRSIKFLLQNNVVKAGVDGQVISIGKVNGVSYVTVLTGKFKLTYSPILQIDVKKGDTVSRDTQIGLADMSGLFSFSLRKKTFDNKNNIKWQYVNPQKYFSKKVSQNIGNKGQSGYVYVGKLRRKFSLILFKKLLMWQVMRLKPDSFESLFRLLAIYDNLSDCSTETGGTVKNNSKNVLILVSGINTYSNANHLPVKFNLKKLGYTQSNTHYFSYGKDQFDKNFEIADTYGSTVDFAQNLYSQLLALLKEQSFSDSGMNIDIVAHSQGGVVVKEFFKNHYVGSELEGKIKHVVNFSSPLEGTPFASLRFNSSIKSILDSVPVDLLDSQALKEMTEFNSYISSEKLPSEVQYLSIGSNFDVIVPATNVGVNSDSGKEISINSGILNAHSEIKNDDFALKAANAFLNDQKMPCLSAIDAGSSLIFPTLIKAIY